MRRFAPCSIAHVVLLGLVLGCTKNPTRPYPSVDSLNPSPIDDYPAWSNDGGSIAYYRFFQSTDGPNGIYIVNRWGGKPRLVAPGFFYSLRFSPDDRQLVCVAFLGSIQVAIIDVATGEVTQPFAVTPGRSVGRPGWSPDGSQIVYARGWDPSEPPDSGGVHIFDLRTGEDRPIGGQGSIVLGGRPIWMPTGQISFIDNDTFGHARLLSIDPDGQNLRVLHTSRGSVSYSSHHWYDRPSVGLRGILFTVDDAHPYGGFFITNPDGSALRRLSRLGPPLLGWDHQDFSPDGDEIVHSGWDPVDSVSVLYVTRMGDQSRATSRQLTRYVPPSGPMQGPSAQGATAIRSLFRPVP